MEKETDSKNTSGIDIKNVDWNEYYKNKSNLIPRDTLVKALEFFGKRRKGNKKLSAIDIGCGHGADTLELLKNGWKVFATDGHEGGLRLLVESVGKTFKKNLRTGKMVFENFDLSGTEKCDLVNASYSLPFCNPDHFDDLWNNITGSIKKGGMFSGQFFGENDGWADVKEMTFHNILSVKKLFKDFEIVYFEEKDEDGKTASGESKHWHVFSVIAEKLV